MTAWLPDGFSLVPGTTKIANTTNPKGIDVGNQILDGMNIGNYSDGGTAYVTFDVRIGEDYLEICGLNAANVAIRLWPDGDWDTAGVTMFKHC